jgi:biopolymer transport protein TolQ
LVILLVFSLFSWAIIFEKFGLFRQVGKHTASFLRMFRQARELPNASTLEAVASASPLVRVYAAGYHEWERQSGGSNPHPGPPRNPQAVAVEMQLAAAEETRRLERWMPFLATTGSVTPFIGLFGTVWGVMDAFSRLGESGAASLRATAPGIAEALITTAAGLFAAIPAVIACTGSGIFPPGWTISSPKSLRTWRHEGRRPKPGVRSQKREGAKQRAKDADRRWN